MTGGLSAPQGRTVRRSKSEHTQKPQCFCPRIFSRRRTVCPQGPDRPRYKLDTQDRTTKFLCPFQLLKADRLPPWTGRSAVYFGPPTEPKTVLFELIRDNGGPSAPLSGPSAGIFPAEMYLGKMAITLNSNVQIWWSWTLWKAYSEGYTTQLNI